TTVRKVVIGNLPFLLSDTVGFIRKLPTQLDYLENLKAEIYKFTQDLAFRKAKSAGDVLAASFDHIRRHYENLNMSKLIQSS
ncbi:MAG: hypothetical protein ACPH19_06745, partial [Flavobacteriaceae bacterium]